MIGSKVTRDEVLARWAYSDLQSKRFATEYSNHTGFSELSAKAQKAVLFADLDAAERRQLGDMLTTGPRSGLGQVLDNTDMFICESWSKEQVC